MSDVLASAEFSDDKKHRRRLDRWWREGPRVLIAMANPSTAGAEENDQTIIQLIKIFRRLSYNGFTAVNFSDRIATDAAEHERWRSSVSWNAPVLYEQMFGANLDLIRSLSAEASARFVAWGNLVADGSAATRVIAALSLDGIHPLYALGVTKAGKPKHPMARGKERIPEDVHPILWRPANPHPGDRHG